MMMWRWLSDIDSNDEDVTLTEYYWYQWWCDTDGDTDTSDDDVTLHDADTSADDVTLHDADTNADAALCDTMYAVNTKARQVLMSLFSKRESKADWET